VLSPNPARRAVERYWLIYTPIWGVVAGALMLSGRVARWGDVELMIMGVAFALGAVVPPLVRVHPLDRARPWWQRSAFKLVASVVGLSFLMNYFCTPYFYEVLHMRFGFRAEITIDRNPVFLYLMTVAYFATYCVLV
jgi:cycloeucalenol cycloisomerase